MVRQTRIAQRSPLHPNPCYIWQLPDWPNLTCYAAALAAPLAQVHRAQGQLMGAAWRSDASGTKDVVSGPVGRTHERTNWAPLLENFVVPEVLKRITWSDKRLRVSHFRTK